MSGRNPPAGFLKVYRSYQAIPRINAYRRGTGIAAEQERPTQEGWAARPTLSYRQYVGILMVCGDADTRHVADSSKIRLWRTLERGIAIKTGKQNVNYSYQSRSKTWPKDRLMDGLRLFCVRSEGLRGRIRMIEAIDKTCSGVICMNAD